MKQKAYRDRQTAFYRLNAAMASGPEQTGPDVYLSCVILGFDYYHPEETGRLPWSLNPDSRVSLYPWLINGVVALMLKLVGFIAMRSKMLAEHRKKPSIMDTIKKVTADGVVHTHGAILSDQTGMGKTILVLFLLSWLVENHTFPAGQNLPTLVAAPQMLVEEWASAAQKFIPRLKIAIMFADSSRFANPELVGRVISTKFTKELPSMSECPTWLLPAWEDPDARNPWVVFASIDTLMMRAVHVVEARDKEKIQVKVIDPNTGETSIAMRYPKIFRRKLKGKFGTVVVDECHRLRNKKTMIWYAIKVLLGNRHLMMSATPQISAVSGPHPFLPSSLPRDQSRERPWISHR